MHTSPISQAFKGTTVFRMPLKTGETAKISVFEKGKDIRQISYEIWKKGTVTEKMEYSNKNGLDNGILSEIVLKLEARAKEGIDFFHELAKAESKTIH